MNFAPSWADAIDVGRFSHHQTLMVYAWLHPTDIVAHDEENVGFLLLLCDCLRTRHHCRSEQREPAGPSTPCAHDLIPFSLVVSDLQCSTLSDRRAQRTQSEAPSKELAGENSPEIDRDRSSRPCLS